ncbi:unnamed protein product [Phytomonas sp. Hart1]|nr:unnamed protein product [Phytomonas sp. Hart1]|eukprot:CCW67201.1 unnamed protein product [Phytomonas sp. isolate Hart1]
MPEATVMQLMEMDMVQGMYDTYVSISTDPPGYSILLAPTADDPPELKVTVTYPTEEYPESAPCNIVVENISKKRRIQTANLTKEIEATCIENIGVHVVVLVLQQIQSFLTTDAQEAEKAELIRRGETMNKIATQNNSVKHDPTITVGTAVTKELFEEWSCKHHAEKEMLYAERSKGEQNNSSNNKGVGAGGASAKLTGRQMWDSTLRNTDWQLFGDAEDGDEDVDFEIFDSINEDDFAFDEDEES